MRGRWQAVPINSVCELISGQHIPVEEYNTEGHGIGYLTGPSDFGYSSPIVSKWTEHPKRTAIPGDVLITVKGSGVGSVNILVDDEVAISRQLVAVRPRGVDRGYVHAFLKLQSTALRNLATGAAIPGLSRGDILSLQLPLPPVREQERIVAILDEALGAIDAVAAHANRNVVISRELFESHLNHVFAEKGEGSARIYSMKDVLSEQPRNGWSPPKEFQTGSGVPVLTLSAITGFEYDGSRVTMSSAPTRPDAHYWLRSNELLMTRSNTGLLVGHVAIYDGTPAKAICSDLIMKMTVDASIASTRFVYYWLRTASMREYISSRATGASSTMKKIGKGVVQALPVPLPSLHEQHQVVTELDGLADMTNRLEANYADKLAALAELKQSILRKAFTGELTAKEAERQMAAV